MVCAMRSVKPTTAFAFVLVVIVAAALRLFELGSPDRFVFDETYYAQDACHFLGLGRERCGVTGETSWMHPPLGKWLITVGIRWFGYEPFGWRIMPAAAGIATVAVLFVLAHRLTRSALGAAAAAWVLALDPLSIVTSRVAMLDVFTAGASLGAITLAVMDRDRVRNASRDGLPWWRLAAGLACGVAIATKWSGVLVLAIIIALTITWELAAARTTGRPARPALARAAPSIIGCLIVLPALVYAASYVGRLDGSFLIAPWDQDAWLRQLGGKQLRMAGFHAGLDATHPAASPAWSWLLGKRAVAYYFETDPAGRYREVLGFANPLLWWPGVVAACWAFWSVARARGAWDSELIVASGVFGSYIPWLVLTVSRPFVFLHYVVPTIPFIALALGWAVARLALNARRVAAAAIFIVAVGVLFFWAPLVYAWPLEYNEWRLRIPFTDCTAAEWDGERLRPRPGGGEPPDGWCWV